MGEKPVVRVEQASNVMLTGEVGRKSSLTHSLLKEIASCGGRLLKGNLD